MIIKNKTENLNGSVDCFILIGADWHPHTMDDANEYELSEESEWQDVKACPQAEKDAHEEQLRKQEVINKITDLESTITPRRLRDALKGDISFLEETEAKIEVLRGDL